MLFVRTLAFLSGVTALAAPGWDSAGLKPRGGQDVCDGGRDYCGWFDEYSNTYPQCKCPPGQLWDRSLHSCVCPPIPIPPTNYGEDVYCAANRDTYCKYDTKPCPSDGKHVVVVAPKGISEADLKNRIDKECKKPRCPCGQVGPGTDKKCKYPTLPKDDADKCKKRGGKPTCARTPKDYCDYDEKKKPCEDDGKNCFKCLDKGDPIEKILGQVFATLGTAVEVLGLDCVLRIGEPCSADDQGWSQLPIVGDLLGGGVGGGLGDVVGGVVGGLCGLLGIGC